MNFSRRRWLLSAGGSAFFASVAKALQTATPRAAAAAGMPGTADEALKMLLKNAACGVTYYSDSSGNKITIPTVTAFEGSLNSIYKVRFNKKYPFSPTAWDNLLWQSVALGAWIAFVQLREDGTGGAFKETRWSSCARKSGRRARIASPSIAMTGSPRSTRSTDPKDPAGSRRSSAAWRRSASFAARRDTPVRREVPCANASSAASGRA